MNDTIMDKFRMNVRYAIPVWLKIKAETGEGLMAIPNREEMVASIILECIRNGYDANGVTNDSPGFKINPAAMQNQLAIIVEDELEEFGF